MKSILATLQGSDSVLLVKLSPNQDQILFDFKANYPRKAASLTKTLFALEIARRFESGTIINQKVKITSKMLEGYGTDILPDLLQDKGEIELNILTLVNLMLKYSCNSSTAILARKFLPKRSKLQEIAKKELGLTDIKLVGQKGEIENMFSLADFFKVAKQIFNKKTPTYKFIQKSLKESSNKYYLFDQLETRILGSKTGTIFENGYYYLGDLGIVEVRGDRYFLGAMIKRKKIQQAVQDIRQIGKELLKLVQKG